MSIEKLATDIYHHKVLYYQGKPEISDQEYDLLEEALRKADPNNPVLQMVGSTSSKNKVEHKTKMLSLDKKYKVEELKEWIGDKPVVLLHKIDGVSCSLIYKDGKLIQAKTRGNGVRGEDITDKVLWCPEIPKTIHLDSPEVEIRGEIFCENQNFTNICNEMESLGLDRPNSPRNIVAGFLGRKDHVSLNRFLSFKAFDLISNLYYKLESDKLAVMEQMGFSLPWSRVLNTDSLLKHLLNEIKDFMEHGRYQIDGAVFVYNDLKLHKELGETSHHPRYKMAFKFAGKSKITTLNSITWQVSRQGILTPVGEMDPVELSDAVLTRVTLHHYGNVVENQLKTGDQIEIIRSGEVIPKFLQVCESSEEDFVVPEVCPECHEPVKVENKIWLKCKNFDCPAQKAETILHFIKNIGIDDLSSKRLGDLIDKGIITDIPSIYQLTAEDLVKGKRFGKTLAIKLIENIEKSKNPTLVQFVTALGLKGGAKSKCEKLIKAGYTSVLDLVELEVKDLIKLDSFGKKSATDFVESLRSKITLIAKLHSLKVRPKEVELTETTGVLNDKKICITGTLSQPRKNLEKLIKDNGGEFAKAVSSKTDILIINNLESGSNKAVSARKHGTKLINEQQFYEMIGVNSV